MSKSQESHLHTQDWLNIGTSFTGFNKSPEKDNLKLVSRKKDRSVSSSSSSDEGLTIKNSKKHSKKKKKREKRGDELSLKKSHKHTKKKTEKKILSIKSKSSILPCEDDLYIVDSKGDKDNLLYGEVYRVNVPNYSMCTKKILGTNRNVELKKKYQLADHDMKENEIFRYFSIGKKDNKERLNLAYSIKKRKKQNKTNEEKKQETIMNYIPLDPLILNPIEEKRMLESSTDCIFMSEMENYHERWIEVSKLYNQQINEKPNDILLWMEFISFQSKSFLFSPTKQQQKAILEKQQSILMKALTYHPNEMKLIKMKLNLLSTYEQSHVILNQYDHYLKQMPNNGSLWKMYFHYIQRTFSFFSPERIRKEYSKAIQSYCNLNKQLKNEAQVYHRKSLLIQYSESQIEQTCDLQEIFYLLCQCEIRLGYTERMIGLFQALIEINLFCPIELIQRDVIGLKEVFSSFWDQELPRFGEKNHMQQSFKQWYHRQCFNDNKIYQDENEDVLSSLNLLKEIYESAFLPSFLHYENFLEKEVIFNPLKQIQIHQDTIKIQQDHSLKMNEDNELSSTSSENEELEEVMVYSNLHGYRIHVSDVDQVSEYKRILKELKEDAIGKDEEEEEEEEVNKNNDLNCKYPMNKKKKKRRGESYNYMNKDERIEYPCIDKKDLYYQWLQLEEKKQFTCWYPLHATNLQHEKLIEKEPERVVLYDEIEPFLFQSHGCQTHEIIFYFLYALGIHHQYHDHNNKIINLSSSCFWDTWKDEDYFISSIFDCLYKSVDETALFLSNNQKIILLEKKLYSCIVSIDSINLMDPQRIVFLRNIFYESMILFPKNIYLKSFAMEYEMLLYIQHQQPNEFIKIQNIMKCILENNSSLILWQTYVYVLQQCHQIHEMIRTCEKVISMYITSSLSSSSSSSSLLLSMDMNIHRLLHLYIYHEYWKEKETNNHPNNQWIRKYKIIYIFNGLLESEQKPLSKIKKKKDYLCLLKKIDTNPQRLKQIEKMFLQHIQMIWMEDERNFHPNMKDISVVVCYAIVNYILFQYILHGFNQAMKLYKEYCHQFQQSHFYKGSTSHEWLITSMFYFAELHAQDQKVILPPKLFHNEMNQAIEFFPQNNLFLRYFIDQHDQMSMSQTLRLYFQKIIQQQQQQAFDSPHVFEWLFKILSEISRAERMQQLYSIQNKNEEEKENNVEYNLMKRWGPVAVQRLRNIYEQSVDGVSSQGCALLWRLYLRFELHVGRVEAAKKIFYRGIHKCPWSKNLYLDGIRCLRPYLMIHELQNLMELMISKEICLRHEPDSLLEKDTSIE